MSGSATFRGAKIVLCVAGGIAAYKAVELLRQLVALGADVQVVMSKGAQNFVGPLTFQALSGRPVFTNLMSTVQDAEIGHIQVADQADLVVVAPATANTLAALAAGRAATPISAVVLACQAPVLLAPSMNTNMWSNPATQRNMAQLETRQNWYVVGPDSGFLACQWTGPGRLAEPTAIVEAAARILTTSDLSGRYVVVTAGPTRESIDPIRFISNRSTGRMGFALARAAWQRGAHVHLIAGPTELPPPPGVEVERVETAADMYQSVMAVAAKADVVIKAAAVADLRPRVMMTSKWKKSEHKNLDIEWERTQDILAKLGEQALPDTLDKPSQPRRPLLVGFAAETHDVVKNAQSKLREKQCDLVVANDVSVRGIGFGSEHNRVTLVDRSGCTDIGEADKHTIAHAILDRIVAALSA